MAGSNCPTTSKRILSVLFAVFCQAAGFEPATSSEATANCESGCVERQHRSAALALHSGGSDCHCVVSLDADLQRVIAAWDGLPAAIRKATLALIASQ